MQIQVHNNIAYKILRTQFISHFAPRLDEQPNMEYVQIYRDWVGADHVLRNSTHFLFCETIPDVDFEMCE
ncbi:MAG: hypothetical protein EB127_24460 [Alphaproteobacteria bacterium]|nr:hypothetical protein [Alphaproteobacteria bacterium]